MSKSLLEKLLDTDVQKFIEEHSEESVHDLVLRTGSNSDLPVKEIAEQIECRRKAAIKLPRLSKHNLVYRKVSLEQASSEATASYKASRVHGEKIIDLTGGLGIDSIYFARKFEEVYYCEIDEELAEIAEYNFKKLGIDNISVIKGNGIEILERFADKHFDYIYIDPARRDEGRRSVDIRYLKPDVIEVMELFLQKGSRVCIKLSPAFDLTEALRIFPDLDMVEVVSLNNECKEVLVFLGNNDPESKPGVSAVMLKSNGGMAAFRALINNEYAINLDLPGKNMFLYEPDVSIRQAGLSGLIAEQLKLNFIGRISVYLVSHVLKEDFPGRSFEINKVIKFNPKEVRKYISENNIISANISRSDFPYKPDELKKMFKLKDGGENYFFFTRDMNLSLIFIHAMKIRQ